VDHTGPVTGLLYLYFYLLVTLQIYSFLYNKYLFCNLFDEIGFIINDLKNFNFFSIIMMCENAGF
jgi:hypothetical protein